MNAVFSPGGGASAGRSKLSAAAAAAAAADDDELVVNNGDEAMVAALRPAEAACSPGPPAPLARRAPAATRSAEGQAGRRQRGDRQLDGRVRRRRLHGARSMAPLPDHTLSVVNTTPSSR